AESVKSVRGSAGLEGASAQNARAAAANVLGGGQELPLGLNRARPSHGDELVPADNKVAHRHMRALAPRTCLSPDLKIDQDIGRLGKSFRPGFAHSARSYPPPSIGERSG